MGRGAAVAAALFVSGAQAGIFPKPYPLTRPCELAPLKGTPACNTSLSLDARVADLVSRIPASDRVGLMSVTEIFPARGVPSLNIPPYQWWNEGLHGIAKSCYTTSKGQKKCPTSFPAAITSSCSFNTSLFHAIGDAIGTEGRVYSNVDKGWSLEPVSFGTGLTFWSPNVNVFRDPRWGRGQETPGEDPTLNAEYAAEFVSGFQGGDDSTHLKASSCCKHYAAYSLEKYGDKTRHDFDAQVPQQDMADTYLPAFQSCVTRGKASGVMCSYNSVNGVPSCASHDLLNGNLRQKWGFDGYVTSDCGGVSDVYRKHHFTNSTDQACADVLHAGMDTDCGTVFSFFTLHLQKAIDAGAVADADVRLALSRLFRVQMRLGMFDPDSDQPYRSWTSDRVDTPQHRQLALDAARQGLVLVKNNNTALPLNRSRVGSVAIVGPSGDATKTLQSNYHGAAPYLISPLAAVKEYVASTTYTKGCGVTGGTDAGIKAAAEAAAAADVTIAVVGLDQTQEREAHDRTEIGLPGKQEQLLEAVAAAAKSPVIVVVISGGPVDLSFVKSDPRFGAVVVAGYPGQSGGTAIAEVLFGDISPSGKLTQTWYPAAYADNCSMFEMSLRPTAACPQGRSHRFYQGEPVFRFGEGLSYSTFAYTTAAPPADVSAARIRADMDRYSQNPHLAPALTTWKVTVKNTGSVASDEVVLMFVKPPRAGEDGRPLRMLRRFRRVRTNPGEEVQVELPLSAADLVVTSADGTFAAEQGLWTLEINNGPALTGSIHIE